MTATNKLRELLDERGVKWGETRDGATAFSDEGGHVRWAIACGAAKCFFEVGPLTPEQAIAATLGSGTCTLPETRVDHGSIEYNGVTEWRKCSSCGEEILAYPAHYCPNCGRKVVDE